PGFVFNVSYYPSINDLLVAADVLITDCSPTPVEFSLSHKPLILYAYELEAYIEKRDIRMTDFAEAPVAVVAATADMIGVSEHEHYNMDIVAACRKEWKQYADGGSSERLIHTLFSNKNRSPS